jgi:sortase (surface protein transpeptidase)
MVSDIIKRDRAWISVARELWKVRKQRKEIEDKEKELSEQLKQISQGMPSCGGGYRFTYTIRKGTINYIAIPELESVNLELYRNTHSIIWKLEKE